MVFGRIPENTLEDILSRVDIVEVISGSLPLKKAGRNFKTNCPFHHEKTASFMVSPDRQIYHCFGCGAGGNAFNFLMQHERLEFPEAVEVLARKAGVMLPEQSKESQQAAGSATELYKVNELAAAFFEQILSSREGTQAKEYLHKRGVKEEAIKKFRLGYTPERWDALIVHLRSKGLSLGIMEKAGLILAKERGGYYDRFRGRIMFPIFDIKSRILGFGGRILSSETKDGQLAKYVNSPETPIYIKGRNLYGLNFARDRIRELDFVAIVEGYLDFIIPYQHGFENILASQGTALTLEQVRLIKRFTQNVVMVYDADKAGEMATLRTLDIFIDEEISVKVASLPKGLDPDLCVRKFGPAAFKERVTGAENLFEYKLNILKERHNVAEIEGKARIAAEMLPTLNKFKNAVLKSEYIKRLAHELKVNEEALWDELKKIKEPKSYNEAKLPNPVKKLASISPVEKLLIKLMLDEKGMIERIKDTLMPEDFLDERASAIVTKMFNCFEQGKPIEASRLAAHPSDAGILELVCESVFLPEVSSLDKEKIVDDCIQRLKNDKLKSRKQSLHERIKSAQDLGNEEEVTKLMLDFHKLIKKR